MGRGVLGSRPGSLSTRRTDGAGKPVRVRPGARCTNTIENNSEADDVNYDPAGNVVQVISARATVVTSRYDTPGRVVERVTGHVLNPDETVYLPPDGPDPSGITLQFPE
jgi:YD repeat-containing protein